MHHLAAISRIAGPRLVLRRFTEADISARYLSWLNDPEVNRHSQRLGQHTSREQALAWLRALGTDDVVFCILHPEQGHVGNLKTGPVDWHNGRCDISILIGETAVWGQGVAREAIYLASRMLFSLPGLHRIDAGSANPAFIRCVTRLGWQIEGTLRQRVRIGGEMVDWTLLAQLKNEFHHRPDLEPVTFDALFPIEQSRTPYAQS